MTEESETANLIKWAHLHKGFLLNFRECEQRNYNCN